MAVYFHGCGLLLSSLVDTQAVEVVTYRLSMCCFGLFASWLEANMQHWKVAMPSKTLVAGNVPEGLMSSMGILALELHCYRLCVIDRGFTLCPGSAQQVIFLLLRRASQQVYCLF